MRASVSSQKGEVYARKELAGTGYHRPPERRLPHGLETRADDVRHGVPRRAGDKTQLLVFNLAAQHRAPWAVFLGASLALSAVSLLAAFVGGLVGEFLPTKYVQLGAGILFFAVGGLVIYRAIGAW